MSQPTFLSSASLAAAHGIYGIPSNNPDSNDEMAKVREVVSSYFHGQIEPLSYAIGSLNAGYLIDYLPELGAFIDHLVEILRENPSGQKDANFLRIKNTFTEDLEDCANREGIIAEISYVEEKVFDELSQLEDQEIHHLTTQLLEREIHIPKVFASGLLCIQNEQIKKKEKKLMKAIKVPIALGNFESAFHLIDLLQSRELNAIICMIFFERAVKEQEFDWAYKAANEIQDEEIKSEVLSLYFRYVFFTDVFWDLLRSKKFPEALNMASQMNDEYRDVARMLITISKAKAQEGICLTKSEALREALITAKNENEDEELRELAEKCAFALSIDIEDYHFALRCALEEIQKKFKLDA